MVTPPPGRQQPAQHPPRSAHMGNKPELPAPQTAARRRSQRREHRVPTDPPRALGPPCAYARHHAEPGKQCSAPPAKVYDAEPMSGSPSGTPPLPQHMPPNGPLQAHESHRRSVPRPCSQAGRHSNGGAHGSTQNAPPISGTGIGTRGHQGAGTSKPRWEPPVRRTRTWTPTWS